MQPYITYVFGEVYTSPHEMGPGMIRHREQNFVGTPVSEVLDYWPTGTHFLHLEWASHSWPGGYEMTYYTADGGVLCHQCANQELERTLDVHDDQFHIVACDANYEDNSSYCDHCNRQIEPAHEVEDEEQL